MSKISALTEGTSIVATDLFRFVDVSDTTMAASGTNKKATAQTLINELAQLIAPTWNNGGTDFTALKVNVTNTASGAGSKLLDLQVGGSSKMDVTASGVLRINEVSVAQSGSALGGSRSIILYDAGSGGRIHLSSTLGFAAAGTDAGGSADTFLTRQAANTLAQRNGTNPQESRLYNTYDGTNDEWFSAKWDSNVLKLGTYASGTGAVRDIQFPTAFGSISIPSAANENKLVWKNLGGDVTFSISGNNNLNTTVIDAVTSKLVWTGNAVTQAFGGTTSSYPSIQRSTTDIHFRLADDSGYTEAVTKYRRYGSGTPEGAVTADVGTIYHRTDGGAGTSIYVKESGTGNSGWKGLSKVSIPKIYFVSTIGNDTTGDGSIGSPYATISQAVMVGEATTDEYAIVLSAGSWTWTWTTTPAYLSYVQGYGGARSQSQIITTLTIDATGTAAGDPDNPTNGKIVYIDVRDLHLIVDARGGESIGAYTQGGNGGSVVVTGNGYSLGSITASGGSGLTQGDGGQIDISGCEKCIASSLSVDGGSNGGTVIIYNSDVRGASTNTSGMAGGSVTMGACAYTPAYIPSFTDNGGNSSW